MKKRPKKFFKKNKIWFYKNGDKPRPILPEALLDAVINTKHFSAYGMHASKARITREIMDQYYVYPPVLKRHLADRLDTCFVCQVYANTQPQHRVQPTDFAKAPRQTWALDLMPSLPKTSEDNERALIAVDYYTGYIQCIPLKNKSSETLIQVLEWYIICLLYTSPSPRD